MTEYPKADDVRALLQSVEADTTRISPNRDTIRRSVFATFDEATVTSVDNEPKVITLVSTDEKSRRLFSSRRGFGWAAAIAASVLAALLLLPDGSGRIETAAPTRSESLSLDGNDLPARLSPGPQSTDSIAGGLSFQAPKGLVVVAEIEGQVILAVSDEPEGSSGRLVIVEMELSDWEGNLQALAEAGDVSLKEIGVLVNGSATTRLDVTITNDALATMSCAVGEPCMSLEGEPSTGPAALWAGSDNRIVEIGRTRDSLVLAIEVSQQFQGPLSSLAAQVVSTASLSPN